MKLMLFIIFSFSFIFANDKLNFDNIDISKYSDFKIEINVSEKKLNFFAINENLEKELINTFIVGTPKVGLPYPKEEGYIIKVELDPWWYPTEKTKAEFRKRNIFLSDAIAPGDKNNYMGPFKIILSNYTKERGTIYRIHGNIDPNTIGKRSSGGCIRMYNDEGLKFSNFIQKVLKNGKKVKVLYI